MPRQPYGFILVALTGAIGLSPLAAWGQDPPAQWERRLGATTPPVTAFHSTQAISLPTAETLARGEFQFEIAHRFFHPVSDGVDAFWGLDGPVNMRLGLGYAPTDRLLVTLARSNLQDNLDIQAKYRMAEWDSHPFPLLIAVQGGTGWNWDVGDRDKGDSRNFQYYGQVILNTLIGDRLAVGLVPSFLRNVLPDSSDRVDEVYLGVYGQAFLTDVLSLVGEWNFGPNQEELENDAGSFGIELETGGHFFKIFLGNSVRLNPSQFLPGTDFAFQSDQLRLGFAITRLLRF